MLDTIEYMLDTIVWYTFDDARAAFASRGPFIYSDSDASLLHRIVYSNLADQAGRPFFIKHLA